MKDKLISLTVGIGMHLAWVIVVLILLRLFMVY